MQTHTHIHTYWQAHTHTFYHMHTHTHTHTHIHVLSSTHTQIHLNHVGIQSGGQIDCPHFVREKKREIKEKSEVKNEKTEDSKTRKDDGPIFLRGKKRTAKKKSQDRKRDGNVSVEINKKVSVEIKQKK